MILEYHDIKTKHFRSVLREVGYFPVVYIKGDFQWRNLKYCKQGVLQKSGHHILRAPIQTRGPMHGQIVHTDKEPYIYRHIKTPIDTV